MIFERFFSTTFINPFNILRPDLKFHISIASYAKEKVWVSALFATPFLKTQSESAHPTQNYKTKSIQGLAKLNSFPLQKPRTPTNLMVFFGLVGVSGWSNNFGQHRIDASQRPSSPQWWWSSYFAAETRI